MSSCSTVMAEMLLPLFRLLSISLLSPKVFDFFLILHRGASKIDLPLSMFSLANSFLLSLFSHSTLLLGGTKTIVLAEAILVEEKSYPRSVQSEFDFWRLSFSSSFALEVLSRWALTWNSFASSSLVFSAKKLFSNLSVPIAWLASSNFVRIFPRSSSTSLSFLVANLYNFSYFSKTLYNFA